MPDMQRKRNKRTQQVWPANRGPRAQFKIQEILLELAELTGPTLKAVAKGAFCREITVLLSKIGKLVACDVGSIWVISPESGKLEGLATFGYKADISDVKYTLGSRPDGTDLFRRGTKKGGGITAYVATTAKSQWFNSQEKVRKHSAWAGKIDKKQWQGRRRFRNCGIVALAVGNEIIGVLKMENFKPSTIPEDAKRTIVSLSPFIAQALDRYRRQLMPGEKQFRIGPVKPCSFEEVELGDVLLEHVLTSICTSDSYYFAHKKEKSKLAERLPMVLGHETVAIVREAGLGRSYEPAPSGPRNNQHGIMAGDHVVVIPQMPCGICATCKQSDGTTTTAGENYCENVKHMASNADGSLRTKYRYRPDLLINYKPLFIPDRLAVLTEPFAQLVQVLRELGFRKGQQGYKLQLCTFREIVLNNAFSIPPEKFDSYFRIFASDNQIPRTLLRLPNGDQNLLQPSASGSSVATARRFSHYSLMRRGLFLSALRTATEVHKKKPHVLVLGTGPSAFIAALLLREAYGLKDEQVYIYGRRDESLEHFRKLGLGQTVNVSTATINRAPVLVDLRELEQTGDADERTRALQRFLTCHFQKGGVKFDVILECIGGDATENLVSFAIDNAANGGIIALFGLSDKPITVDFENVLDKEITFKGFFRACRGSYFEALEYLEDRRFAEKALELVPRDPKVIENSCDLDHAFEQSMSRKSEDWGKVLVRLADTGKPIA